jgi:orotidine-5'-phosphate decarboxylase
MRNGTRSHLKYDSIFVRALPLFEERKISSSLPMPESTKARTQVDARSRLIVALDVPSSEDARRIVDSLEGSVDFFKVGLELYTGTGLDFVRELRERQKKVFLDLKCYDVGETIKRTVKIVVDAGVYFLTVHGNGEIVQAAAEARAGADVKLLSVTVLTSLDVADIRDLGYKCSVEELAVWRAIRALNAGCDGVISSAREARLIKEQTHNKLLVVTPGIRPRGTRVQDHKRAADPGTAVANGADYLVVGRPITAAPVPRTAAEDIISEMQTAFDLIPT